MDQSSEAPRIEIVYQATTGRRWAIGIGFGAEDKSRVDIPRSLPPPAWLACVFFSFSLSLAADGRREEVPSSSSPATVLQTKRSSEMGIPPNIEPNCWSRATNWA